jgi:flagellar basal-body rod protein FlgF
MDNTVLVGLSQQMASMRAMDVVANNLANLSTPGYRRETVQFQKYVATLPASEADPGSTIDVTFVIDSGISQNLMPGRLETTGSTLDFAIEGAGYFAVQTPNGERYTRNGHFRFDEQGQVVTQDGYVLQGDGGPITLQPQDGDLRVGADGSLSTALQRLGKLRVVAFPDERALKKAGGGLYEAPAGVTPAPATAPRVRQGMIEKSNVEPVMEITRMIEVMRAYQMSAELTKSQEDLLKQAIQNLGAVPVV